MPGLRHNPELERHLTLAALGHCPREYWYVNRVARGVDQEEPANSSLLKGILVHVGIAELWRQRQNDRTAGWKWEQALAAIDQAPEVSPQVRAMSILEMGEIESVIEQAKKAVVQYASQWGGVRDFWRPVSVSPTDIPPKEWTILANGEFISYPDLIVEAQPMFPVVVADHKTSRFKFEANKWEYHPELLTQCLAAQKLVVDSPVFYMIDYLQAPAVNWKTKVPGDVWSFPATPVWEFTDEKKKIAESWIEFGLWKRDSYAHLYPRNEDDLQWIEPGARPETLDQPWPQEISQCQTPWGMCRYYNRCFGDKS